jgi:hypothetical protein
MKQKFFRGQRVRIADQFPVEMHHFEGRKCDAIIDHSYSDVYGCGNYSDYGLIILPKRGNPYYSAWYPERLLTLVSDDRVAGEKIIQQHNERITKLK